MPNVAVLKSPLAFLKILISATLTAILLLASYGNDGQRLSFGVEDFLGVGASLGLALVVPLILIAYVFGGSLFVMEALLSMVGGALLIGVGIITFDSYDHPEYGSPAGKALGGLSICTGGLFMINFLFVLKTIRDHSS
ncbi:uncharacterized protein [Lepeophtheirus salmonis]|uniref:uncharacterized protein n=1 Tax=Lepeophtheirus salmonis TaxID=72036 RepID=UPI001AE6132E|nr:uncharacterized protein LOC121128495 [Lepeophtheirus salmonis]XP_040580015.1 uncharacterized protein LOC121128495 [Lepeophtheirus salmonis]